MSVDPPGQPTRQRHRFIDVTRGLLVYWMLTAHAMTICRLGPDSWLYYLRPPGWSTHGFIMLSGFSTAYALMGRGLSGSELQARLGRRAVQLAAWAVSTEMLSRALVDLMYGPGLAVGRLLDPRRPWSLSAILIPTVLLFSGMALAAPRFRAPRLMPLIAGLAAVVAFIEASGRVLAGSPAGWTYGGGVLGVPVPLFLALASLGVGLGLLSKRFPQRVMFLSLLLVGVLLLIFRSFGLRVDSLYYLGTFFVTLSVGGGLSLMSKLAWIPQLLSLFGRSALLVFVAHRFVLQMIGWPLRRAEMGPSEGLVVPLLALVTALMAGLCWTKESVLPLRRRLAALGL